MNSDLNPVLVRLLQQQVCSPYALSVYGGWTPGETREVLIESLQATGGLELRHVSDNDKPPPGITRSLLKCRKTHRWKSRQKFLLIQMIAGMVHKTNFPALSDADLKILLEFGEAQGYLKNRDERWLVTPAGLALIGGSGREARG